MQAAVPQCGAQQGAAACLSASQFSKLQTIVEGCLKGHNAYDCQEGPSGSWTCSKDGPSPLNLTLQPTEKSLLELVIAETAGQNDKLICKLNAGDSGLTSVCRIFTGSEKKYFWSEGPKGCSEGIGKERLETCRGDLPKFEQFLKDSANPYAPPSIPSADPANAQATPSDASAIPASATADEMTPPPEGQPDAQANAGTTQGTDDAQANAGTPPPADQPDAQANANNAGGTGSGSNSQSGTNQAASGSFSYDPYIKKGLGVTAGAYFCYKALEKARKGSKSEKTEIPEDPIQLDAARGRAKRDAVLLGGAAAASWAFALKA